MLAILQELDGLLQKAKVVTDGHAKKSTELEGREANCAQKESDLNQREASLNAREANIVPIENMGQWKKDVQALEAKVAAERESLEADKKKWTTQVQADKGQIENDRAASFKEAKLNEDNRNNIEAVVLKRVREVLCQYGQTELAAKV